MSRERLYADRAEQMRAYRQRQKTRLSAASTAIASPHPKPASRPARLTTLIDLVQALYADYESWHSNLPESLANSSTGQKLAATVEQLAEVAELLAGIDPPKGYGRD